MLKPKENEGGGGELTSIKDISFFSTLAVYLFEGEFPASENRVSYRASWKCRPARTSGAGNSMLRGSISCKYWLLSACIAPPPVLSMARSVVSGGVGMNVLDRAIKGWAWREQLCLLLLSSLLFSSLSARVGCDFY